MIEELFHIAHANAMELSENQEDEHFLESQRKIGLHDRSRQGNAPTTAEAEGQIRDVTYALDKVMRQSSTDSEENQSESEEQDPWPSTSTAPLPRKRAPQSVISPELAPMFDRNGRSDRAAINYIEH